MLPEALFHRKEPQARYNPLDPENQLATRPEPTLETTPLQRNRTQYDLGLRPWIRGGQW